MESTEKTSNLWEIEYRVQFNHQTRQDSLQLLEVIRELRRALVKAVIPLHVLNMVYHDKEEFHPDTKQAILDGIEAVDSAIMTTKGITMWQEGEDGRRYGSSDL